MSAIHETEQEAGPVAERTPDTPPVPASSPRPGRVLGSALLFLGAGVLATAALFVLIPLMNRSSYRTPQPRRYSRLHWMRIKKSEPPPSLPEPQKTAEVRKPPPPPEKPPPPRPKFAKPPPPAPRTAGPSSPLRVDPLALHSLTAGTGCLHVPVEPPASDVPSDSTKQDANEERDRPYSLHDIDRPPRVAERIQPAYPSKALRRGVEGYVLLKFTVDAYGRARDIDVADRQGDRCFADTSIRALRKWRFRPGTRRGKAVSVRCSIRFTFQQED